MDTEKRVVLRWKLHYSGRYSPAATACGEWLAGVYPLLVGPMDPSLATDSFLLAVDCLFAVDGLFAVDCDTDC
jgi:hypothetical protein